MPDSEKTEELLRKSLAGKSVPSLSSEFDKRLLERTGPGGLSSRARNVLVGYSVAGVVVSVVVMAACGLDWRIAAISVVVPVVAGIAIVRGFFGRPKVKG